MARAALYLSSKISFLHRYRAIQHLYMLWMRVAAAVSTLCLCTMSQAAMYHLRSVDLLISAMIRRLRAGVDNGSIILLFTICLNLLLAGAAWGFGPLVGIFGGKPDIR